MLLHRCLQQLGFRLYLKLVLCLERWFLIHSFGLSNPQLQQATGVSGYFGGTQQKQGKNEENNNFHNRNFTFIHEKFWAK